MKRWNNTSQSFSTNQWWTMKINSLGHAYWVMRIFGKIVLSHARTVVEVNEPFLHTRQIINRHRQSWHCVVNTEMQRLLRSAWCFSLLSRVIISPQQHNSPSNMWVINYIASFGNLTLQAWSVYYFYDTQVIKTKFLNPIFTSVFVLWHFSSKFK